MSAAGSMHTWQERHCAACGGEPRHFARRLFWQSLHRRALPLALLHPGFFAADRELIGRVAGARSWRELNEELRDFVADSRNHPWWRRRARLRVSTRRLRALARPYLLPAGPAGREDARQPRAARAPSSVSK